MHMLYVREELRGQGLGTWLVTFWESQMRESGYEKALTSTLSDKNAQHLYRKLDYEERSWLLLPGEPLQILFVPEHADVTRLEFRRIPLMRLSEQGVLSGDSPL